MAPPADAITLSTQGKIAIITLNQPKKLNALDQALYMRLADLLREVAARDDIFVTVLTGKGRFFSACARPLCLYPPPNSRHGRIRPSANLGLAAAPT